MGISMPHCGTGSRPSVQSHQGTYLQGPGQTNFTRVPLGKNTLEPASTVMISSVGSPGATSSRVTWSSIFPSKTITYLVDHIRALCVLTKEYMQQHFQASQISLEIVLNTPHPRLSQNSVQCSGCATYTAPTVTYSLKQGLWKASLHGAFGSMHICAHERISIVLDSTHR